MKRELLGLLLGLLLASLLAGCGFQLRGQALLPFTAAHVEAARGSALGDGLRQSLRGQGKLAEQGAGAPVRIRLTGESRQKNILSLSGAGKVREYRLEYRVDVSVFDATGRELTAPAQIYLTREFSYSDEQVLAKESEEAALYRAMEQEALRQVLRRLSYLRS
mgnify:CR=1 FL=1